MEEALDWIIPGVIAVIAVVAILKLAADRDHYREEAEYWRGRHYGVLRREA